MTEVPESGADTGNDKPTHAKTVVPDTVVTELASEKSDKKWGFGGNEDFAWNALVLSPVQDIIAKPEARSYSWSGNGVSQSLARESVPGSVFGSYYLNDNRGDNRGQPFVPLRTTFGTDTGIRQSVFEAMSVPRLQGNDLMTALEGLKVPGALDPVLVKPITDTSTQSATDQTNRPQEYKLVPNPDTGEMQLVVTDGSGQQRTIVVTKALDTKDQVVLGNGTAIEIPKDVRVKGPEAITAYVQKQAEQLKDKPVEFSLTQNGEPLTVVKRADGSLAVLSRTSDFKDVEQAVAKANKEPAANVPVSDGNVPVARQILFKPNDATAVVAHEDGQKLQGLPKDAKVQTAGGLKEPTISRNAYETGYSATVQPKEGAGKVATVAPKPLTFDELVSGGSSNKGSVKVADGGPVNAGLSSRLSGGAELAVGQTKQVFREVGPELVGQAHGSSALTQKEAQVRGTTNPDYINRAEMIRTTSSAPPVKKGATELAGARTDPYAQLQHLHDLREGALDPKPGLNPTGAARLLADNKQTDFKSAIQRLGDQKLNPAIKEQIGQQPIQRGLRTNTSELPAGPQGKVSTGGLSTGDLAFRNDGVIQRQLTATDKGRIPTGGSLAQFSGEAKTANSGPKTTTGAFNAPEKNFTGVAPGPKTDKGVTSFAPATTTTEKGALSNPGNLTRGLGAAGLVQDKLTVGEKGTALANGAGSKPQPIIKDQPVNDRFQPPKPNQVDPRQEQMREQAAQRKVTGERSPTDLKPADLTKTTKVPGSDKPPLVQTQTQDRSPRLDKPPLVQTQAQDRSPRVKPNDARPLTDALTRPIKQGDTNLQAKLPGQPRRLDTPQIPSSTDIRKVVSQVGRPSDSLAASISKLKDNGANKVNDGTNRGDGTTNRGLRTGDGSAYTPIKISRNFSDDVSSKTIAIKGDKVVELPNKRVTGEAKVAKSYTTNTPLDLTSKRLVEKANQATTDIRTAGNTTTKRNDTLALAPKLDSAKTKAALADVSRGLSGTKIADAARSLTARKDQAAVGDKSYTVRLNNNNIKQIADRALVAGAARNQQQQAEKGQRNLTDKVSKTQTARLTDLQTSGRRPVERQITINPKALADKQITSGRSLTDKLSGSRALIEKGAVRLADNKPATRALTDKVINNAARVLGDRSAVRILTSTDRSAKTSGGDKFVSQTNRNNLSDRQIVGKDNHAATRNVAAERQPAIARHLADNSNKAVRSTNDQSAVAGRRAADRPDLLTAAARAEKAISQYVVRSAEKGSTHNIADRLPQLTAARAHELMGKAIRTAEGGNRAGGEKGGRIAGEKELSEKALGARDKADLKGLLQLETKSGKFTINVDAIKRDIGEKKVKHDDYSLRDGMLNCADKRYLTGIELLLAGLATISAVARVRADQSAAKSVDEGKEMQDALPGLTIENWDGDEEEETLLELAVKRGLMGNIDRSTILTRPKYMVQPGDTLTSIAEEVMHDSMLAWLILHINAGSIKTQWEGDICLTELELRQEIELPVAQDIVEFYRSRPNLRFKNKRLVTTQKQNTFDRELLVSNFRNVIAGATARKAQDLPAV